MSSRCSRYAVIVSYLMVLYLSRINALEAQSIAVFDATRSGDFNVFDGPYLTRMRAAAQNVEAAIVPLGTLVDLDAGLHDVIVLHNGFSPGAPLSVALSEAEQAALRDFVEEGGGALVAVDSYGGIAGMTANSILSTFDVAIAGLTDSDEVNVVDSDHPVLRGQDALYLGEPSWFADLGPCAKALASLEPPGGPVLAVIEGDALAPRSGRVVLTSDANWILDSRFDAHEGFFVDSVNWLAEKTEATAPAGDCDDEWEPTPRLGTFENCRPLGPTVNGPNWTYGASVTRDGLCLVFESKAPGGSDIFMATRDSEDDPFGAAVSLGINWQFSDSQPNISPDGLKIYFSRTELDPWEPNGTGELFVAERATRDEPFGDPTPLDIPGLPGNVAEAVATEDDLTLIIDVRTGPVNDLFEATRESVDEPFEELRPMTELNTLGLSEMEPSISADGLALFFSRWGHALCWTTRPSRRDSDGRPVPFDTPRFVLDCPRGVGDGERHEWEAAPFVTPDWPAAGSKLYFTRFSCRRSDRGGCGGDGIWVTDWVPSEIPAETRFRRGDCSGDGEVNITDPVCILNWLFAGDATPGCVASANTNGDGGANVSDATYLLNHLFSGGPAPVAPFPDCGVGAVPADTELGCADPAGC